MKKNNENGSTIVTGIVIVMIIFVILGTALAIATNYQQRSVNEHARKQAYLYGVSVVESIAGQIGNNTSNDYIPVDAATPIVITSVDLPSGYGGKISAKITLDASNNNVLYIEVTSIYNTQTEKIKLTMQKYQNKWYKNVYSEGDEA